jgi:TolB-like protein
VQTFLAELKKRGVLKVLTAYLVVSWLVLEVGHTLFLIFELPHIGMQIVFVLLALGFPVAAGAAWRYRFAAAEHPEQHSHEDGHGGSQLAIVFATVALLVIGTVIVMRFMGYNRHGAGHGEDARDASQTHAASPAGNDPATLAPAESFTPPEHSVAVMPFVNMSGDIKDEYFSDGLSEELLNSLVRINELQVAARTSSFSFKGTATDIPTIGRKLNVATVLEGSVRKVGARVRITAQLINAVNGYHLWSETFDRELKDILALQTEIATAVTAALKVKLLPDDNRRIVAGGSSNPGAYDAYLRGIALQNDRTDEASDRAALAALEEAVRLDPGFALAHAACASSLTIVAFEWTADRTETRRLAAIARAHSDRAVQLAPALGAGYEAQSRVISQSSLDLDAAETAARHAMELEPGNAKVLVQFADIANRQGRFDEAFDAATRAVQLDPLSSATWRIQGTTLYNARRHEEAASAYKKALALQPENRSIKAWMALNELALGHLDEAISLCEPDKSWYGRHCLLIAYHKKDRRKEAAVLLRDLKKEYGDELAYQYSQLYAQWGEPQQALEWLVTAVRLEDPGLWEIQVDPLLDPIRDAPQFKEVLRRLYPDSSFPRNRR